MLRDIVELVGPHCEEEDADNGIMDLKKMRRDAAIRYAIWLILWVLLILFVGRWLWNESLVPAAPNTLRPLKSIWQFAGIAILFVLLFK